MGGWTCRYQVDDQCRKMKMVTCDPGMPGCVLRGKYHFPLNEEKDRPLQKRIEREENAKHSK